MTKYVLSGYIGYDNFGDELIASTLIKHLQENKDNVVTVISANPKQTSFLYNCLAVEKFKFLLPIIKSDVLISGGGSLLQDITSLKSLIYYLTIIFTALIFRKKVIIFAQGITPFRTKIGAFLTKFILKKCYKITLRDKNSIDFLKKWKIEAQLIFDPAWSVSSNNNIVKKGIGVQLRYYKFLSDDFLNTLAKYLSEQFSNQEIKLLSLQDSVDLPILEKFKLYLDKYGLTSVIKKNLTVDEIINEINQLEFLIGMRFHACLIASKLKVKVLGINYDIKVKTLSDFVNFPVINIFPNEVSQGIKELISINIAQYKIPDFYFPEFNL